FHVTGVQSCALPISEAALRQSPRAFLLAERSSAASCACLRTSLRYESSMGHQRLSRCQTPTPLPPSPRMFLRLVSREPTAQRKPAGIPCLRSMSSMNGHCLRAFLTCCSNCPRVIRAAITSSRRTGVVEVVFCGRRADVVDSEIREAEGVGRRPFGASVSLRTLWSGLTRRTLGTPFTSLTLGTSRAGVPLRSLISCGSAGTIGAVVPVLAVSTRAPRCSPVAFLSAITLRPPRSCITPVSFGSLRTCGAFLGSLSGLATAQTLITGKLRVFLADVLQLIRECLGVAFRFEGIP